MPRRKHRLSWVFESPPADNADLTPTEDALAASPVEITYPYDIRTEEARAEEPAALEAEEAPAEYPAEAAAEVPAGEYPAEEAAAEEAPAEEYLAEEAAAGEYPAEEAAAEEYPAQEAAAEEYPAEEAAAEEYPAQEAAAEEYPAEEAAAEEYPAEEAAAEEAPAEYPAEEAAAEAPAEAPAEEPAEEPVAEEYPEYPAEEPAAEEPAEEAVAEDYPTTEDTPAHAPTGEAPADPEPKAAPQSNIAQRESKATPDSDDEKLDDQSGEIILICTSCTTMLLIEYKSPCPYSVTSLMPSHPESHSWLLHTTCFFCINKHKDRWQKREDFSNKCMAAFTAAVLSEEFMKQTSWFKVASRVCRRPLRIVMDKGRRSVAYERIDTLREETTVECKIRGVKPLGSRGRKAGRAELINSFAPGGFM